MITICKPCGTTTDGDVEVHLAEAHPNEMFEIDTDPNANLSVIRRRIGSMIDRPNPTRVTEGHRIPRGRLDWIAQILIVLASAWIIAFVVVNFI